jgi:hypothetical protein
LLKYKRWRLLQDQPLMTRFGFEVICNNMLIIRSAERKSREWQKICHGAWRPAKYSSAGFLT